MTVVDTSVLMEVVLGGMRAAACIDALSNGDPLAISAATLAEALIVADRRRCGGDMLELIDTLGLDVRPVTTVRAHAAADAYSRWGKGVHPAGLNLGDCFAYALATELAAPLLFVGNDFAATDIGSALA